MHLVIMSLLIIALVAGLVCVVILPTPLLRTVALLLVCIPVFFITYSVIVIGKEELMVWNYNSNIRPAGELWSIVGRDVDAGQYDLAKAHLALVVSKWPEIRTKTSSYSARDLLKVIESDHNNTEQGTEGKPPKPAQPTH